MKSFVGYTVTVRLVIILFLLSMSLPAFSWDLNKEYVDAKNEYKIRYPSDWQLRPYPNSKDLVKADITSPDNKSGIQIRIYERKNRSFDDFIAWYKTQFLRGMKNVTLIEGGYTAIGYKTGYSIRFDGRKRNGYLLKSHIILFDKIAYVFQSGAPFDEKNEYEKILDAIAQSFEKIGQTFE